MKSSDIESLLPAVIRVTLGSGNPAGALLKIMEELHEPTEAILADIDSYFNPRRAPDPFLPYLAHWLDLDRFIQADPVGRKQGAPSTVPLPQLREWIAAAASLSKLRGTARGLQMLLETATGITGFQIIEGVDRKGAARPFHLRVVAPPEAESQRRLIARIIELEKPAYVTCDGVEFGAQPEKPKEQ